MDTYYNKRVTAPITADYVPFFMQTDRHTEREWNDDTKTAQTQRYPDFISLVQSEIELHTIDRIHFYSWMSGIKSG